MNEDFVVSAIETNLQVAGVGRTLLDNVDVSVLRFNAGDTVHHMGDEVTNLYCLTEGWITLIRHMANGDRQLLNFHVPIDIVGFEYLGRATATSDMVAFRDTELVSIPIQQFKRTLLASPESAAAVTSLLSRKYSSLQTRLCVFANGNAVTKVIHFLHGLRSKQVRNRYDDADTLRIPLTQQDIADALGVTNVTISRAFAKLEAAGVVDFNSNRIRILDYPKMLELSSSDVAANMFPDEFD